MARFYRFEGFRLDPATRELWRGDAPVAVPPRAFNCIVYLVEHRQRAVGRDELIAAVWGKTEITDGMLGQTVLAARRAFDDTGREQHFIRTVVRLGYHWVAATEAVAGINVVLGRLGGDGANDASFGVAASPGHQTIDIVPNASAASPATPRP